MEPSWARQFFVDLILSQALVGRIQRSHRVDRLEVLFARLLEQERALASQAASTVASRSGLIAF